MRITLRPTVAGDLEHVLGVATVPCRIKAITALSPDGRVLGVGGIGFRDDGGVVGFAALTDELRRYPTAVHRAGRLGMAMVRGSGVRSVVASAQPGNPAAERWLIRLGFVRSEGGDAFIWRRLDAKPADRRQV